VAELRLEVDPNLLTVNDLIALEEGGIEGMRATRDFVARFVVSGDGEPVTPEEAQAMVGALTLAQLTESLEGIGTAYQAVKESAVDPPTSAS